MNKYKANKQPLSGTAYYYEKELYGDIWSTRQEIDSKKKSTNLKKVTWPYNYNERALLKDRNDRIDLICDLNHDRNYFVPMEEYEAFITNKNLDVEKYNIKKNNEFLSKYYNTVSKLEEKYEEQIYLDLEYEHFNENPIFIDDEIYDDEIYLDDNDYLLLQNKVKTDLKEIYRDDYFDPYVNNSNCY